MAMSTHKSRQKGGLFGLLIGDALGVPYEFHRREAIPDPQLIEMTPPDGFRRAHRGVPPGTWSDDGAQALCLLASLLDKGRLELDDFAARLLDWYEKGYLAVDGRVFDVGVQTTVAFRALMGGAAPHLAGPAEERSNGNGSLMRVLPLALWHQGTDEDLVRDAYLQSRVTHGHARSRVCCALYCLWARRTLSSHAAPWDDAVRTLRSLVTPESEEHEALEVHIAPDAAPEGRGTGYVVDTLRSARMVASRRSYEDAVRAAVTLGDDTDTTACVAGGIVGLREGYDAIPGRWRSALRGQELVTPLVDRLLARSPDP
jgi:ADP-ribosylglycohydrolase